MTLGAGSNRIIPLPCFGCFEATPGQLGAWEGRVGPSDSTVLPMAQHRAEVPSVVPFLQQASVPRRFLPFVVPWDGKDAMPKLEKI